MQYVCNGDNYIWIDDTQWESIKALNKARERVIKAAIACRKIYKDENDSYGDATINRFFKAVDALLKLEKH